MNIFKKIRSCFCNIKFQTTFDKLVANGTIKPFDEHFYAQFEGKYLHGLPIYYYLRRMNMGRCYDASAVLGLAMGAGCYICRGELGNLTQISSEPFGHSWVETDTMVYDTTWQIICPKDVYYKLFGVKYKNCRTYAQFFEDCKDLSDWSIHTKEYYETQPNSCYLMVMPTAQIETELLQKDLIIAPVPKGIYSKPNTPAEKELSRKVLRDLPDIEKCYQQMQRYFAQDSVAFKAENTTNPTANQPKQDDQPAI